MPNQQRTLNKLPTGLRCRNFVNKHRLSIQVGAKRAETCMQRVHIPTELPLCIPPLVVGYEHGEDLFSCLSSIIIAPPPHVCDVSSSPFVCLQIFEHGLRSAQVLPGGGVKGFVVGVVQQEAGQGFFLLLLPHRTRHLRQEQDETAAAAAAAATPEQKQQQQ